MQRKPTFSTTAKLLQFSENLTDSAVVSEQKDLIEEVIDKVSADFISGRDISRQLTKKSKTEIEALRKQCKDDFFPTYSANRIADTHFIAAEGPGLPTLPSFIKEIIFNKKTPAKKIIVLATLLGLEEEVYQDCYDYCSGYIAKATHGPYQVEVTRISGEIEKASQKEQIFPKTIIQSKLSIQNSENKTETAEVEVTIIPLTDMSSISFKAPERYSEGIQETLGKLFKQSENEYIAVHCQAGLGRTGHFILMAEIFSNYDKLFASKNANTIAGKIISLISGFRAKRPELITTKDQCIKAIRNAHELRMKKNLTAESTETCSVKNDDSPSRFYPSIGCTMP